MQGILFKIIKFTGFIFYFAVFNYYVIITESRPPIRNVSGNRPKFLIISHRSVLLTVVSFVITGLTKFGLNTEQQCEGQARKLSF